MKKTISILLAVVLLISALPVFASAQSAASVDIKGMSAIAEAGVTIYSPVMIDAQNITTLAVEVTYDKTVFELIGVEKFHLGNAEDENIAVDGPDITTSPYRFDWAYINQFNYDGIAANVKLKVKDDASNGNYQVTYAVVECADTNGVEAVYDAETVTVTVTDDRTVLDSTAGWPSSIGDKAVYVIDDNGTEKALFNKGPRLVYGNSLFVDGIWTPDFTGPMQIGDSLYYFVNSAVSTDFAGVVNYEGKYYFVVSGKADTVPGWKLIGSDWYYVDSDGYARIGWTKVDSVWYYLDANGVMVHDCWMKDSTGWVYLGSNGAMLTNAWCTDSHGWCYVGADGYAVTNCWKQDSIGWIWLNGEGSMTKSEWIYDGYNWYYLDSDGYMVSNCWQQDSKGWCYLGSNGAMVTNAWVPDSVGWCYIGADGYAVTNCWKQDSIGWIWLNGEGSMTKSAWVHDGYNWYYLDSNGYMVTGTHYIDGKYQTFASNGVWLG